MSGKNKFRFLLSTIFMVISVLIIVACAQREVKQETPAVETPPAAAESTPTPASELAPAAEADKAAPSAPAPEAAPAPQVAPAPAAGAAGTPEQYKNIDPSLLIYLSSRGVLAGTGDPSAVAGDAEDRKRVV